MRFFVSRLASTALVLWGVSTITFLLIHMVPGDPVDVVLGPQASQSDREVLRSEWGLDKPLSVQYLDYFKNLLCGDWGKSYLNKKPVLEEIASHLGPTLALGTSAMIFAILLGIPLGILSSFTSSKVVQKFLDVFSTVGLCLPSFWLAPVLILIFSIQLDWLPIGEQSGVLSYILPSVSLGFAISCAILRMTQASMKEVIREEYVNVASAKGLSPFRVFFKHALKNALLPIVTIISLQFGAVLTGVVITETIFDWPGIGLVFFNALHARNYPLVQGCVLTVALIYITINLITDFIYSAIDPRMRRLAS